MKSSEINFELSLSYSDLCSYLLQKYGPVPGNYFTNETCSTVNTSIKRSNEGLEIHHLCESLDSAYNLSSPVEARQHTFDYQLSKNLCYCNLLEHLILHIKINLNRASTLQGIIIDGAFVISQRLDELYEVCRTLSDRDRALLEPITNNYSDYINLTNTWLRELKQL